MLLSIRTASALLHRLRWIRIANIAPVANLSAKGELKAIDLRVEPVLGPPALYQDPRYPYRSAPTVENHRKEFEPIAKKLINLKEKGLPGVPTCIMSEMFVFAEAPKVFAIGPVLNFLGFTGTSSSTNTIMEGTSLASLEFLSTHPTTSVLYISFGSLANISPESRTELAHGLEGSGVPFVWALRLNGSLAGATLPPGFEERMKGRGYIGLGRAPQAQILSHPSIGGFLSHCGWNSALESLCA